MKYSKQLLGKPGRFIAAVFVGSILLMGAGDDSARVDKLGHKLICMCGCNQVLLECNHYGCPYLTPMQQELNASVAAGKGDEEILRSFVATYGKLVLAAPTTGGFDLVAWIMPYVALAVGIGGVVLVAFAWHNRRTVASSTLTAARPSADLERFREQARKETEL